MALKAGRVGVHPSQVDSSGMIIGGEQKDVYTKSEVDALLGGKVNSSHLKANNKNFYFAYDAESNSYGYKLNGQGDFIPFKSGVDESGIYVVNPITTGITYYAGEYVSGGYEQVGKTVYIDMVIRTNREVNTGSNLAFFLLLVVIVILFYLMIVIVRR